MILADKSARNLLQILAGIVEGEPPQTGCRIRKKLLGQSLLRFKGENLGSKCSINFKKINPADLKLRFDEFYRRQGEFADPKLGESYTYRKNQENFFTY